MGQEPENTPAEGEKPAGTANPAEAEVKVTKSFDEDYVKTLRAENAAHRKKAQEAIERLEALEERDKTEAEKAAAKATKEAQRAEAAEAKLTRYEVAAEKGLPSDTLDLLSGTTREELEAKADRILELVKNRTESEREPDFDGGAREPAPEPLPPEQQHNVDIAAALFGGTRT
jgi:hypothetical protein